MNDTARSPLFSTSAAASATPTTLPVQPLPRRVADLPGAASEPGIRVPWRRLDRLASAATLGLILASPETALQVARTLGPRIPSLAPAPSHARAATPRREVIR
jgi:hypothetical protein